MEEYFRPLGEFLKLRVLEVQLTSVLFFVTSRDSKVQYSVKLQVGCASIGTTRYMVQAYGDRVHVVS